MTPKQQQWLDNNNKTLPVPPVIRKYHGTLQKGAFDNIVQLCAAETIQQPLINKYQQTLTNIQRYGCANPAQNTGVQSKAQQTCVDRYGHKNPAHGAAAKQKIKQTCLDRYGVSHHMQNAEILAKTTRTFIDRFGGYPTQHPDVLTKTKQTCLEKYGVEHPVQNSVVREKTKQTCLEKYGVEHPWMSQIVRAKINQTFADNYGCWPTQHPGVQASIRRTCLDVYGCHPRQTAIVINKQKLTYKLNHAHGSPAAVELAQRIKSTNIQRYGTASYNQQHMAHILPLVVDFDWLYDQYINQNKTAMHIASELGITDTTLGRYLRSHEIAIHYTRAFSYKCINWLSQYSSVQHALNGGEYNIPGTRYKVDGYCKETNTVYEFHGNVFHGNPRIYSSDYRCHPWSDLTAGELYSNTKDREAVITNLGYNLVVMWEDEYDKINS